MNDLLTSQGLSSAREGTEPGRQVQGPAAEAARDLDGFAGVQPDPDRKGERRVGDGRLDEGSLQVDRGTDRLTSRCEDCEYLISAELEACAPARLERLACDRSESGR